MEITTRIRTKITTTIITTETHLALDGSYGLHTITLNTRVGDTTNTLVPVPLPVIYWTVIAAPIGTGS
jgi:hypothetical protein